MFYFNLQKHIKKGIYDYLKQNIIANKAKTIKYPKNIPNTPMAVNPNEEIVKSEDLRVAKR